jgi:hypothetical protein
MSVGKRLYVDWYVVAVGDFYVRIDHGSSGYPELVDFDRADRFVSARQAISAVEDVYPDHTVYQINAVNLWPVPAAPLRGGTKE